MEGLLMSLKAIPVEPSLLLLYRLPGGAVEIWLTRVNSAGDCLNEDFIGEPFKGLAFVE